MQEHSGQSPFVHHTFIVRKIWGSADTILLIFAGAAAEFALNKFAPRLSNAKKEKVYSVFYRVGERMGLKDLLLTYAEWLPARAVHLAEDLQASEYAADLFKQYRKHLGTKRFKVLTEGQKLVVPERVKQQLHFNHFSLLTPVLPL